ncbi:MAG: Gfo/Idh/MocA family oxidoreductase [Balneolaceae bacterium]|nr:Gfo/Idh/MocA family oxidoreductase [Balneolaceae bacterium]
MKKGNSRRKFISDLAKGAIGSVSVPVLLANTNERKASLYSDDPPDLADIAPDGQTLKAGLVGCGGRGTGAAVDFIDAGPNLEVVALGDVFQSQVDRCRQTLKAARGVDIPDENCFAGFDSYEKVLECDIDVILLATPPNYRPEQVKASVEAGKHIFQEKPIAVDPVGARIVWDATQKAKEKNLCMVSGTARRYQKDYQEVQRRVARGEIGDIVSANMVRNGGASWWTERQPGWSDAEYMLWNWANFSQLSGDHIVEMFVHEIDVMHWHFQKTPVKAIGYGGRQRRRSGNQYDFFSIEYIFEDGRRANCSTRQINGCDNVSDQIIVGTEGYADAVGTIYNSKGEIVWEYPYPAETDEDQRWRVNNRFKQEHIEFVRAIRTGEYLNDSEDQINSTRMAIMGRMAAYTGRDVTWEEVLNSDMQLGPQVNGFGPVPGMSEEPPVPGEYVQPVNRTV